MCARAAWIFAHSTRSPACLHGNTSLACRLSSFWCLCLLFKFKSCHLREWVRRIFSTLFCQMLSVEKDSLACSHHIYSQLEARVSRSSMVQILIPLYRILRWYLIFKPESRKSLLYYIIWCTIYEVGVSIMRWWGIENKFNFLNSRYCLLFLLSLQVVD